MPNPWDIPAPEPRGDADGTNVFATVGKALTEWETVETACARIFAFLVGAPPNWDEMSPAVRAFGVVISFPTRCEMITTAGKAFFHLHQEVSNYEKYISDALSEAREYSNRRNEIASVTENRIPSVKIRTLMSVKVLTPPSVKVRTVKRISVRVCTDIRYGKASPPSQRPGPPLSPNGSALE